jgi:hypothetical protein
MALPFRDSFPLRSFGGYAANQRRSRRVSLYEIFGESETRRTSGRQSRRVDENAEANLVYMSEMPEAPFILLLFPRIRNIKSSPQFLI